MTLLPPRHRFIVETLPATGTQVALDAARSHQLARVLRLRPGDRVTLCDGRGDEGEAELVEVDPRRCRVALLNRHTVAWRFPLKPLLYLPLIRPQRFDWAVEKAVELGVAAIVPLLGERTTHGSAELSAGRLQRLRLITREAAEQCGAAQVPEVGGAVTFREALARPADLRLLACEDGRRPRVPLCQVAELDAVCPEPPLVALFVGPEGGFSPEELEAADAAGCRLVTLGPLVLRSETAALAMLAQLIGRGGSD